jgi:hypothetical protein
MHNVTDEDASKLLARFEADGEAQVRQRLAQSAYNDRKCALARHWLETKDREWASTNAQQRADRDREALEIAREANKIALKANDKSYTANRIAEDARRHNGRANWIAVGAAIVAVLSVLAQFWTGSD